MCETMKLEHFLMPCIKISSEWIKDLNAKYKTENYKTQEENKAEH